MRLLLTWADRSAGRQRGSSGDPGPILRLLQWADPGYDAAVVLMPRAQRGAGRSIVGQMRRFVDRVELRLVDLPDPSDHGQLFAILRDLIEDLPEAEVDVLLSAGTPQAQTVWVIAIQAGLLNARMLQVIPPQFVPVPHPHPVRPVRFDIEGFPEIRALREEVVRLRAQVGAGDLVGVTPPMQTLQTRMQRVAQADVPVLILGETGTGKELVARSIHRQSDRADRPFVAENCGAFTESVLASELFGHEAGAFTGAQRQRRGLFEQADGGTLFLDEVGELSPAVQVRLLRVLQEGVIRRVGGEETVAVDVRILAATHRDLPAMVHAGTFREDLYYRLRGATLQVPPLRERLGDLEPLAATFLKANGRSDLRVAASAWQALHAWHWPGNVRELQAEVRRWTVFCDAVVEWADLASDIRAGSPAPVVNAPVVKPAAGTLADQVSAVEQAAIVGALAQQNGNLSGTARQLGIDRNTLKRKMKRFGLRSAR
jgi:DNA-binding NtrC family response regulator